jgi:hypothetical protein
MQKWRKNYPDTGKNVPITAMAEVLCAAHLSGYVEAPFRDCGGIILVGPPGVLKSTLLYTLEDYQNVVVISDLNVQSLTEMREAIAAKTVGTLVIPELAKLYERDPRTAANLEGHLRALVDEGFKAPSFKPQEMARLSAHCVVLSAITEGTRDERYNHWKSSGFNRRFLWPLIRMERPEILDYASDRWQALDFRLRYLPQPPHGGKIPNLTTPKERQQLREMLKHQPGPTHTTQAHLMVRMLAVLKWWYRMDERGPSEAMHVMKLFGRSLGKEGAELSIPENIYLPKKRHNVDDTLKELQALKRKGLIP